MKKANEKSTVDLLNAMCVESLEPEMFQQWERIKEALVHTRHIKEENQGVFDDRKMPIGGLEYMQNFEAAPPGIEAESALFWKQVVKVKFRQADQPLTATIVGIHQYGGKVKYDLAVWLEENEETRIYNVDSLYVRAN